MQNILVVIPFASLYPPMNGGMLRGFNLLNQMNLYFNVTAVIRQDVDSFNQCHDDFPALRKCKIISTANAKEPKDLFSLLPGKFKNMFRYRFWNRSLKGPAEGNFLAMYPLLKRLLKSEKFDFVILEDMSILNLSKLIKRYQPNARIIYDAYNVNSRLAESALQNKEISQSKFDALKHEESTLAEHVDAIFTCSELDLLALQQMNTRTLRGAVIPNGVNIPDTIDDNASDDNVQLLFCGSLDYSPNREGLLWFCREVMPLVSAVMPGARLIVVGRGDPGAELAALLKGESVIYYGMVDRVGDYYKKAAMALVPLLSGSGTRLKLLEAMGYQVAVVSTSIGAEGIAYADGKNIAIADDPQSFANRIADLLNNRPVLKSIAKEGYLLAKHQYDWNVIGHKLESYLKSFGLTKNELG